MNDYRPQPVVVVARKGIIQLNLCMLKKKQTIKIPPTVSVH